ncbi:hypothetical protein [Capillimicrobium parvum]|uniref:DUF2029 domain-containing protein n=1 Tax=Capillimicrobium parvum TaxID=2884022 RepID=A0A9E6Y6Z8_9ACTN|nr:hypothetical protein [Capillimicrobium parvum]UGS39311.1 hypothetical protein DSM104329_05746 [Capillimicrobium parvum]
MLRRTRLAALALLLLALALAAPAAAQTATSQAGSANAPSAAASTPGVAKAASTATTATDPNALTTPSSMDERPPLHRLTGNQAQRIAERVPKIRDERAKHKRTTVSVYQKGANRWQVSFFAEGKEIGQVSIWDPTGAVLEAWTGPQVAWTMARGYEGAFGRKAAALYVWIPLLVLFVAPFVDWRRPLRMRHLDLLALCSLSVSLAFFNHGNLAGSVPTTYPPLLYLLGRLLWIGYRRGSGGEPLKLLVPVTWLAVATIFLVGFRIGLNVTNSNVIDVGYSGVIGADRLSHGQDLYGDWPRDNEHGDTYGPANYLIYVPFEAVWPWSGSWNDLPAAHGAAVLFDLLCLAGLFLLGRRIRGPTLGVVLAYAWAAFPFTLFSLNTNSNDALVAALLIGAMLAATSAAGRGAFSALAATTKLAPLILAPLLATHGAPPASRIRTIGKFAVAFAVVAAITMIPVWLQGDLRLIWDRTVGFQLDRGAPFSVWGYYGGLDGLQKALQVATAAFAIAAAFIPRRRDVVGLAAIAGAILIALQLGMTYWFYLYIIWVLPFAFVAFFAREPVGRPAPAEPPPPPPADDVAPVLAAS